MYDCMLYTNQSKKSTNKEKLIYTAECIKTYVLGPTTSLFWQNVFFCILRILHI